MLSSTQKGWIPFESRRLLFVGVGHLIASELVRRCYACALGRSLVLLSGNFLPVCIRLELIESFWYGDGFLGVGGSKACDSCDCSRSYRRLLALPLLGMQKATRREGIDLGSADDEAVGLSGVGHVRTEEGEC